MSKTPQDTHPYPSRREQTRTYSVALKSDSLRARVRVLSTTNTVNSPWRHGIIPVFLGRTEYGIFRTEFVNARTQ